MVYEYGFDNEQLSPAAHLNAAIAAACTGEMPTFTADSLAASLGLADDRPDGQTLMDRFTGGQFDFGTMRAVSSLIKGSSELLDLTNRYKANDAQEAVAGALGLVVGRQIIREGDICPGARSIAQKSTRADIIPDDIKRLLSSQETHDEMGPDNSEALRAVLDLIFGRGGDRSELIEHGIVVIDFSDLIAGEQQDPPHRRRLWPYGN